jgi:hypothetical protein
VLAEQLMAPSRAALPDNAPGATGLSSLIARRLGGELRYPPEMTDVDGANLSILAVRMTRLRKNLCGVGFNGQTLQVIRHEGYQLCLPVQLL